MNETNINIVSGILMYKRQETELTKAQKAEKDIKGNKFVNIISINHLASLSKETYCKEVY